MKKLSLNIPNKFQGFPKYHFTPLEVLVVIEGIQKCLDRQFTPEEIENGILKDLIVEEDYDLIRVVTIILSFRTCILKYANFTHIRTCISTQPCTLLQRDELNQERRKVISDQAKKLIRDGPNVLEAAEKEFKGILN